MSKAARDFAFAYAAGLGYFNSLSNALEMRARIRSVNDKITYAAEVGLEYPQSYPRIFSIGFDRCNPFLGNC